MLSILTLISYVLFAILLMNMMAKARPRVKEAMPGRKLKSLPMGLVSRYQLQRSSLLALLVGVVFGISTGWLSLATAGIVTLLALLTILIPMQYTFTTQGVALGEGMFYPWKEFTDFGAGQKRVELAHPSLFGRLTLFVQPAEMSNLLETVERYVKQKR
jgi:small-conductance mechanosensitive channel